jgi:molybdopterin synthase sulfur carrier subunit
MNGKCALAFVPVVLEEAPGPRTRRNGLTNGKTFAGPQVLALAKVTVRMYATVRDLSGQREVLLDVVDVGGLVRSLSERYGERFRHLLEGSDRGESAVVLLNGRNLSLRDSVSLRMKDGDELSVFPPVSGG